MTCEVRDKVRIRNAHFKYLVLQRGDLWGKKDDATVWCKAYNEALVADYDLMRPALPHACANILDVGSGLGGIGILLDRHYRLGRGGTKVHLLDGTKDQPAVVKHNQTFSDEATARDFYDFNGSVVASYIDAKNKDRWPDVQFDLVVSTRSWCFHYAPDTYMDQVLDSSTPETQLIVDLRRDRPKWREQLELEWRCLGILGQVGKADRTWWALKAD